MEEGLHVLLQDMVTKLFDIEAQVIRVCEGGRSANVCALDKGARTTTFLRNRRFMDYDPKFKEDRDFAMAAVQGMVGGGHCLSWKEANLQEGFWVCWVGSQEDWEGGVWYPQGNAIKADTLLLLHSNTAQAQGSELGTFSRRLEASLPGCCLSLRLTEATGRIKDYSVTRLWIHPPSFFLQNGDW